MDAGGLASMTQQNFAMPASGLASRRGGQNLKPLSFDAIKPPSQDDLLNNGVPTPRTSRSHMLAGLRTAPKTSTATTFANGPASPTAAAGNGGASGPYDSAYGGPKTSYPRLPTGAHQQQQASYNPMLGFGQQYTADQILAPPEVHIEEHVQDHMDPNLQAQLLAANQYLSEQQQRLQQQLLNLQAAAQQFQGLSLGGNPYAQASYQNQYGQMLLQQQQQQQQQLRQLQQQQQAMLAAQQQANVFSLYDPATGQQTLYVDQSQLANGYPGMQMHQQAAIGTPRVQVSPPPSEEHQRQQHNGGGFRNVSPPRRYDPTMGSQDHAPLPPPSANAFRRGHKKSASLIKGLSIATGGSSEDQPLRSAGPKTASFPLTPSGLGAAGSYGPGQARAGEHPVRQPRNPPSLDELKSNPTSKHEGSKNFVSRTTSRRSAVHNLVRAGLERHRSKDGVRSNSCGSISPISETAEDVGSRDNESDSGRSGSGSLVDPLDDVECSLPSSRTSTGSWGAIGSDRPSSRQKLSRSRGSVDSAASSENEAAAVGSFASLLKKGGRAGKAEAAQAGNPRKAMLVLGGADKRRVAA